MASSTLTVSRQSCPFFAPYSMKSSLFEYQHTFSKAGNYKSSAFRNTSCFEMYHGHETLTHTSSQILNHHGHVQLKLSKTRNAEQKPTLDSGLFRFPEWYIDIAHSLHQQCQASARLTQFPTKQMHQKCPFAWGGTSVVGGSRRNQPSRLR